MFYGETYVSRKEKKKPLLNETTPKKTARRTENEKRFEKMQVTQDEQGFETEYRDFEQEIKSAEPTVASKADKKKKVQHQQKRQQQQR